MNTNSGFTERNAAVVPAASSKSAATGRTPASPAGRLASPCTRHPCSTNSADAAAPAMPLAPATKAVLTITNPSRPNLATTARPGRHSSSNHAPTPSGLRGPKPHANLAYRQETSKSLQTHDILQAATKILQRWRSATLDPAEADDPLQTDRQASPRSQILRYFACTRLRRLGRTPGAAPTAARRSCRSARSTAPPSLDRNARPVSRHSVADTASVTPMFIALPTASLIIVCGRRTLSQRPAPRRIARSPYWTF